MALKRICSVVLAVFLLLGMTINVSAAEDSDVKSSIQELLLYCGHYGSQAETDIARLLETIYEKDPAQGETWTRLLENWKKIYEEMEVVPDCLPDGLPQDDSLCIVVMGFNLEDNGSPSGELLGRLEVALRSAQKYPNAYILCTGGETSDRRGVTEAGVMKSWLMEKGIDESRILLEEAAMSTTENARLSHEILRYYPGITSLALVTSQFHVKRSVMMFDSVSIYSSAYHGTRPLEVAGNGVYVSDSTGGEGLYQQAWGLAILAGVEFENVPVPMLSALQTIAVTGKTEYEPGEFPQFAVTAHYDSGFSREVTASAAASGFDPTAEGWQTLTISYRENGITAEETVNVLVGKEPAAEPVKAQQAPDEFPVVMVVSMAVSLVLLLALLFKLRK